MKYLFVKQNHFHFALAVFFLFLLIGSQGFAGEGEFHGPTWDGDVINEVGKIDIHVLLDSDNTMSDAELETYFTSISEELYDATEKQVQLGIVKVYKGSPEAKDKADLLVSNEITRAYTYAGNFGNPGAHGRIYLHPNNISLSDKPIVVHEMGHLVFNIKDSYCGYLQETSDPFRYLAPNAKEYGDATGYEWRAQSYRWDSYQVPYPDTTNTFYDPTPWNDNSIACLMDFVGNNLTEFSTPSEQGWATDHRLPETRNFSWATAPNGDNLSPPFTANARILTKQNAERNNQSAWETIIEKRPSMRLPTIEPTSDIAGHQPIDFQVVPAINELSVCIDRSGSMCGDSLNLAKISAGLVVALTHERYDIVDPWRKRNIPVAGDYLSLTSFSNNSSLVFSDSGSVAEMTLVKKILARATIIPIGCGGATSIGSGLVESRNTFSTNSNLPKSIIVLSDGHENTSPYVSQIIQSVIDRGIRVYSVGLGSGADKDLLRNIADQTGGEFFFANNAFQLPGIFATLYGNLRNDGLLKIVGGLLGAVTTATIQTDNYRTLSPSSVTTTALSHTETVKVDSSVGEATFLITWNQGTGAVGLIDPDGTIINNQNVGNFSNIIYTEGEGFIFYRVMNVSPGDWQMQLSCDENSNVQWELKVFSIDNEIQFQAQTEKTTYLYPESVVMRASCMAPQPVIGGQATAVVARPDGSSVNLGLFDDGNLAVNGDQHANDGVYSGIFDSFSEDGVYTVTAKFDSTGGVTPTPSNTTGIDFAAPDPNEPPLAPEPVEHFERHKQFTFSVSGIPDTVPAIVYIHPETLNIKSKGKFITAYIEFTDPYDVSNIDTTTVVLKEEDVMIDSALPSPIEIVDHDLDGKLSLMVKFNRQTVIDHLVSVAKTFTSIDFTVEGVLTTGETFKGNSVVQVINPGE